LGWGISFTDTHAVRTRLEKSGMEKDLDDVLSEGTQSSILDSLTDLPLDLAFLDIEGTLPKLSTLAMGGTEYVNVLG
jgi:anaphase-promoting complex subunit 4